MFYEPFIRRAAGLGHGTHRPDPDRYETRHAFETYSSSEQGLLGLPRAAAGRAAPRNGSGAGLRYWAASYSSEGVESPAEAWRRELELELGSLPNVD